jgi:hypothetical protein
MCYWNIHVIISTDKPGRLIPLMVCYPIQSCRCEVSRSFSHVRDKGANVHGKVDHCLYRKTREYERQIYGRDRENQLRGVEI